MARGHRHLAVIDLRRRNICGRLIATATRHAHTQQKARRIARDTSTHTIDAFTDHDGDPADTIAVWDTLRRLPLHPTDRLLIEMTRLQGYTIPDAARQLGITATAATSRRNRAEQRLTTHLRPPRTARQRTVPGDAEPASHDTTEDQDQAPDGPRTASPSTHRRPDTPPSTWHSS